jgi:hypothetical protein
MFGLYQIRKRKGIQFKNEVNSQAVQYC